MRAFYFQSLCAFEPRHLSVDVLGGGVVWRWVSRWPALDKSFRRSVKRSSPWLTERRTLTIKCSTMSSRQPHFLNLKSLTFNLIDSGNEGSVCTLPPVIPQSNSSALGAHRTERQEAQRKADRQLSGRM